MRYGLTASSLPSELFKDLDKEVVRDDESWGRLRSAFSTLLHQWGNAAVLVSGYVGGQYVNYDHKAEKGAATRSLPCRAPSSASARGVVDDILSDRAFTFSPALLRKLTSERWYHGVPNMRGARCSTRSTTSPAIQRIVLSRCLSSDTLSRLLDHEVMTDNGGEPLRIAEVFRPLTDGIWSECPAPGKDLPAEVKLSTIRRNLQRAHLQRLSNMVLGSAPAAWTTSTATSLFFAPPRLRPTPAAWPGCTSRRSTPASSGPGPPSSTTPPAPTSKSAGSGSTRSSRRTSTPTKP